MADQAQVASIAETVDNGGVEERAIIPYSAGVLAEEDVRSLRWLGKVLVASGFFEGTRDAAQAITKILAGRELGIGPIEAMTGFHIVQNKIVMGAHLCAAQIRRDSRYDYGVIESTETACELAFYRNGDELGHARFTIDEARNAGLVKPRGNWEKWPADMLYARAMTRGKRRYCPDARPDDVPGATGISAIYAPGEIEGTDDWELEEMAAQETSTPAPVSPDKASDGSSPPPATEERVSLVDVRDVTNITPRPWPAPLLRDALHENARLKRKQRNMDLPATEAQCGLLAGKLDELIGKPKRIEFLDYMFVVTSTKDLDKADAAALLDWLIEDVDGDYQIRPFCTQEAEQAIRVHALERGQVDMFQGATND